MNRDKGFLRSMLAFETSLYVLDIHYENQLPPKYEKPSIQDITWDYVIDLHEGETAAFWWSLDDIPYLKR